MTKKRWDIPKRSSNNTVAPHSSTSVPNLIALLGNAAKILLLGNSILAGVGYLYLSGFLSRSGIEMTELEISLPSLLLYGYLYTHGLLNVGNKYILLLINVVVMLVGVFPLYKYLSHANPRMTDNTRLLASVGIVAFVLLAFITGPAYVFKEGASLANKHLPELAPLNHGVLYRTHAVETDNGTIRGVLITADQRYTYLQSGRTVYKISNDSQKVVRTITLTSASTDDGDKDEG